jgi:hypothetical protein
LKVKTKQTIKNHFKEARAKYPGLELAFENNCATVYGPLSFEATYDGICLSGQFDVKIILPSTYPEFLPSAFETGKKIPYDFHKHDGGSLCLASRIGFLKQYQKKPDLLGYIDNLLIPYLYTFVHKEKYNYLPYGELSHGQKGLDESYRPILKAYRDKFKVASDLEVLKLLKVLAEGNYRGHLACPCGSSDKLRNCHGQSILDIKKQYPTDYIFKEYFNLLSYLYPNAKDTPQYLLSERLFARLRKL